MAEDPWYGVIEEFLSRKIPEDWENRLPDDRRQWWANEFEFQGVGLVDRKKACAVELWYELFGKDRGLLDQRTSRRLMNVLRRLPGWTEIGPRPTVYGRQRCFALDATNCEPKLQKSQGTKTTEFS